MRRPFLTFAGSVLLASALVAAVPATALADPPSRLADQVTDTAGALDGDEGEVDAALDQLREATGVQLFVAFVPSFDGLDAQSWASETVQLSGLGVDDYLLAVAVDDREYAYRVQDGAQITEEQFADVAREDVEPRLAEDDWAGAVVAAAGGIEDELAGGGGGGGALTWVLVGAGALSAGAVGLAFRRRRRRATAGGPEPSGPPAPTTEELAERANRLLVETDDALRSSDQEVGFAAAEFGEEQTRPFAEAVREAREAVAQAFAARQLLEDDQPESEPDRRRLLEQIIALCTTADERLDSEAERFATLRDLLATAPQRLADVPARADTLDARLPDAEQQLADLRTRYAATALGTVDRNADEARGRTAFARDAAERGLAALRSSETRGEAAVAVQASDEALDQAGQLLDAVARAGSDLADAVARLPAALADVHGDLAAARAEGTPPADLARAEEAVRAAEEAGSADPLGSLRRVLEADAALGQARTTAREERAAREHATRALDQALLAARAEVQAVEDFVATRRGAVGGDARTRLAEARRHLDAAERLRPSDPSSALDEAIRADQLAVDAGRLARADVDGWYDQGPDGPGGYGGMGGMGGPGGPRGRTGGSNAGGMLAGIIIGQVLGGMGGGGGGGGFGGGFGGSGSRGGGGGFGGGGRF